MKSSIALALLAAASITALAQGPKRGSVDVAVGGGYAYLNINQPGRDDGEKNHGILDASVSYNVVKLVSVGFEYAFTPLDSETIDGVKLTEHLHNYGGVARFVLLPNRAVVPYALVAGGGLSLEDRASLGNQSVSFTQSGGYFGVGGGTNIYVKRGFGVRPEFRYQRQQLSDTTYKNSFQNIAVSGSGRNEIFLTGSVFYQFGGRRR